MKKSFSIYVIVVMSFILLSISVLCKQANVESTRNCFVGNTRITMHDESAKAISEIEVGDIVLSYNVKEQEFEEATVTKVHQVMHNRLMRIRVSNGTQIEVTPDHPFLTPAGWVSVNPEQTKAYERYKKEKVEQLDISTGLYYYDVTENIVLKIVAIDGFIAVATTYTIELDTSGAFIANSFLVGQE